jgi:hypothetical protein
MLLIKIIIGIIVLIVLAVAIPYVVNASDESTPEDHGAPAAVMVIRSY